MAIKLKKDSFKPAKEVLKNGLNKPNITYLNPFDKKRLKTLEMKQKEIENYLKK